MDYAFCYDLAYYLNESNKGSFTYKEIACLAYEYKAEFDESKNSKCSTNAVREILNILVEDNSDEAKGFICNIFDWALN